jgi:DnaJ-class molecular chaperone
MSTQFELYNVLGVQPNATTDEIKKAYKKIALKCHPDKCQDQSASEQFQIVNQAYEILSNEEKRSIYDKFGMEGFNESGFNGSGFDPFAGMGPFAQFFRQTTGHSYSPRIEKIFKKITLVEYFTLDKIMVPIPHKTNCPKCVATGFEDKQPHICTRCKGTGYIMQTMRSGPAIFQHQTICDVCRGSKRDMSGVSKCKKCVGSGIIDEEHLVEIDLPRDILKDNVVHFNGNGYRINNSFVDFAIIFNLEIPVEDRFYLSPSKILTYDMHINFSESICGFTKMINHPSRKKIYIQSDPGNVINPNIIFVLDKLGLRTKYDISPLHLEFVIHYPEKIIIPNSKKLAFTYNNLGKILGDKLEEDCLVGADATHFNLCQLEKINTSKYESEKNPHFDQHHYESEDDVDHGMPPGCAQQ